MKKKLFISAVFITFLTFTAGLAAPKQNIQELLIQDFINLISEKEYLKAYNCLSQSIKEEISMEDFSSQARDIKKINFLKLNSTESSKNLKKYNLKAWVVLIYEGKYYKALYEGQVKLNKVKNKWFILSVELEPAAQKEINKIIYFGI